MAEPPAPAARESTLKVLYQELLSIPAAKRRGRHWEMDADMWRVVRSMPDTRIESVFAPALTDDDLPLLLGHPVEIVDGAEGIHLVPDETVDG